ncbi:choice-of-anchor Q domain-containing protein [Nannocystaceae bacterium ST9]
MVRPVRVSLVLSLCALTSLACRGDDPSTEEGGTDDEVEGDGDGDSNTSTADTSATDTSTDADTTGDGDGDTTGDGDGDGDPPSPVCDAPIDLYDTSTPSAVIGDGTPASCTSADLVAAAEQGGTIGFDCGPDPITIALDDTIELPIDTDTIIDGGGLVTLDAQGQRRHFHFEHPDWMNNPTKIVLQRLRLIGGAAPLGEYFPQDPENPLCAYGYKDGSGGSIFVRNGVLHVIESEFEDNVAALEGPDVAGGAIYALGVPEVVIVRSRFVGNRASNGGAIGMLFANPDIYDSVFEDNEALGVGQNYVEPGCPEFNHAEQGGAGGNSGAVVFDGLNDEGNPYTICGAVFRNNRANELGGALFRTPNAGVRELIIDRSLFEGNTARLGGVSFIMQNDVTIRASTFADNRSGVLVDGSEVGGPFGGVWIYQGSLALENSTFVGNDPSALNVESASGTVVNATFVDNAPAGGLDIRNSLFVDAVCGETAPGSDNLQWPAGMGCTSESTFGDPMVGPLADNGGPTPTVLPASGGVVEGIGVDCPAFDQRGEARDPGSCAAGAVEP